jgi:hypothetical protein
LTWTQKAIDRADATHLARARETTRERPRAKAARGRRRS